MSRKRRKRKGDKITPQKSGGIAFFMSLFFLTVLTLSNIYSLPGLWGPVALQRLVRFLAGFVVGGWFASTLIKGRHAVLIHEVKHAIISGFAGNKWKRMKVKGDSGYFRYAYSKSTAEYNAFIALAPYWLPLFTLPALLIALPIWWHSHELVIVIVGIGYGADCILNIRDISPVQSDITHITGGFNVGLSYIVVINLAVVTILLAWVMEGVTGLTFLLFGLWKICLHIVAYYQAKYL